MSTARVVPYISARGSMAAAAGGSSRGGYCYRKTAANLDPSLAFYRKHTEDLMRRYLRISMDMGRLPSLLSRTVMRGRATCTRLRNFEDAVVFVIDVERCLARLDGYAQELVARVMLQEYTYAEAAELTGQSVRSIARHYGEVVDQLTALLMDADLLRLQPWERCQERERATSRVSTRKH